MTPEVMPMLDAGGPPNSLRTTLATARYIRFGPLQIDQQRQEVTRNGTRLKLQGKVYQVLLALLEKPGEVVTREELRQRLWPADTHVNYDANVNTTVNKLRQALGDSSDKPLYIETVPRRGYCFVMQPEMSEHPAAPGAIAFALPASANSDAAPQHAVGRGDHQAVDPARHARLAPALKRLLCFLIFFRRGLPQISGRATQCVLRLYVCSTCAAFGLRFRTTWNHQLGW
jgi:DNA-binding winged helix-turn-helix (wHTH) protein